MKKLHTLFSKQFFKRIKKSHALFLLLPLFVIVLFFITRGVTPKTSELQFTEYSALGKDSGSVVPASCDSGTSHFYGDCWVGCPYGGGMYDPYNYPYDANCNPAPQDGSCGGSPFTCNTPWGNLWAADNSGSWDWACNGNSTGNPVGCSIAKPQDGACGGSPYSCNAGGLVNNWESGDTWYWGCTGSNGGNLVNCNQAKPQDGACGGGTYSCAAGSPFGQGDNGAGSYIWWCSGANGGGNASCSQPIPVDGACASNAYNCGAGNPFGQGNDGAGSYIWWCSGANGGMTSPRCSQWIPVDGACGSNTYECAAGDGAFNLGTDGTSWTWYCSGSHNGATASCSQFIAVDGVPGPTPGSCTVGTLYGAVNTTASGWTWSCSGFYGGATVSGSANRVAAFVPPLPSCIIPDGQSRCQSPIYWTAGYSSYPIDSTLTDGGLGVYTSEQATYNNTSTVTIPYGGGTYRIYDGVVNPTYSTPYLAQTTGTASCKSGSSFGYTGITCESPCQNGAIDPGTCTHCSSGQDFDTNTNFCVVIPTSNISIANNFSPSATLTLDCSHYSTFQILHNDIPVPAVSLVRSLRRGDDGRWAGICIQGSVTAKSETIYYSSYPPAPVISLITSPRTISKGATSFINWTIQNPTPQGEWGNVNECAITAQIVCTNNICSTDQNNEQARMSSFLSGGNDDDGVSIADAIGKPKLGSSNAIGSMTTTFSYSTKFTVSCGHHDGTVTASTIVNVTSSNEQ